MTNFGICDHPLATITRQCRSCRFWGGSPMINVDGSCIAACGREPDYFTAQTHGCQYHETRPGEPLGCGLSRWWWHPTLFESASIIHDLRYDALQPGESTAEIDAEWHRNALALSDSWAMRRLADFGYLVIRIYGRLQ